MKNNTVRIHSRLLISKYNHSLRVQIKKNMRLKKCFKGCLLLSVCFTTIQLSGQVEQRYHGIFQELPSSSIHPQRWLKETLERQRDGMALHRDACGYPFNTNLWVGKLPKPQWQGYEQTAYFIDGIYRAGLLLNDPSLLKIGLENIHYVLNHPEPDGHLGPVAADFKMILGPDGVAGPKEAGQQWPFTVFTRAIMAYYEATRDSSVLTALTKHYMTFPVKFGVDTRDVDAIEGMCWLYWHTGNNDIIQIAERTWKNFVNSSLNGPKNKKIWTLERMTNAEALRGHGVSVSELSKQAALLYLATGKKEYLDAAKGVFKSLKRDDELADGVLSSDAGLSGKNPDHQHETCVITDYNWSRGYMLMASGNAALADGIERATYNAGYGVITKDFKSLEYYSAPNQVYITQTSNHPKKSGVPFRSLQSYRTDHVPECCTGNIQRTFPTFIGRMWMKSRDNGIAAVFYGPSSVSTEAGINNQPVTIEQQTDYPFQGEINLTIKTKKPVSFPLYLRIPGWVSTVIIKVNGKEINETIKPGTFFKLKRVFSNNDKIIVSFAMPVRKENSAKGGISILRGPLLYSLKIKERMEKVNNTPEPTTFPGWNIYPENAWNYGLEINDEDDLKKFTVQVRSIDSFPWTLKSTPIVIKGSAKKIDSWQLVGEHKEMPVLPEKGAKIEGQAESIELVPYGATLIHLSVFPDITKIE